MTRSVHGVAGRTHNMRVPLPRELIWLTAAFALASLLTPNPLHTLAAVLLVPALFLLLWRPGEIPALLFACGYQWLQIAMPVISANIAGIVLAEHPFIPNLDLASYLGLLALLTLALGMRIARGAPQKDLIERSRAEVGLIDGRRLLMAYLLGHLIAEIVLQVTANSPGLRQPTIAMLSLRWVAVFTIFWAAIYRRWLRPYAILILLIELVIGLLGFFSTWKQVLFVAIVVVVGSAPSPRTLVRPQLIIAGVLVLAMGLSWQTVKPDYRDFLNKGTAAQVALVPPEERARFLIQRSLSIDLEDIRKGFESGVDRVGYLEYFGNSMQMVPELIPYQKGQLWQEALLHPLQPRLFFPDKPAIDDSDRVNQFTGLLVADADQGTSVSLGYVAESYIDFGPVWMFVPIFLLGAFWGFGFRLLSNTSRSALLSLAFATTWILALAIYYETSNTKLLGGGIAHLLGSWLILRFGGRTIWRFLRRKGVATNPATPGSRTRARHDLPRRSITPDRTP